MNKMIAELMGMQPQELAQYAAANQNDTMKFLAAKAASDMQKKQMAASAAQQQQAAAPPVAQQVVQQMAQGLPEDSGIGALPAPNMRGYAGGGIVAFADKGLVDDTDATSYDDQVSNAFGFLFGDIPKHIVSAPGYGFNQPSKPRAAPTAPTAPTAPGVPYTGTGVPSASTAALRSGASTQASQAARADRVAAPRADTGAARTDTGATTAPGAGPMSIAELQKLQTSLMPQGQVADPYAAQHEEVAKLRETQGKEELAGAEERKAGLAGLLAPKEQRIKDKEARLQKTDDQNLNMSLINAGLAMMQSRGQGLAGIAEGAGVGVKQYSEGLKLSEAARQKIEDAKDAFDELKFNQTNMSQKDITAAKRTIAEGAIASKNETIAGIKEATGVKTKAAEAVFTNYVQSREAGLDRASRERTSAASNQTQRDIAAMPGREERVASILGAGGPQAENLRKGMEELLAIQSGKFSVPAEYAKYLAEWVKGGGAAGPKMSMAEYAAQFAKPQIRP
jgi:hypothetical protein